MRRQKKGWNRAGILIHEGDLEEVASNLRSERQLRLNYVNKWVREE